MFQAATQQDRPTVVQYNSNIDHGSRLASVPLIISALVVQVELVQGRGAKRA